MIDGVEKREIISPKRHCSLCVDGSKTSWVGHVAVVHTIYVLHKQNIRVVQVILQPAQRT